MSLGQQARVQRLLDQAQTALDADMLAPALRHANEAVRRQPDHPQARLLLASIHLSMDRPTEAIDALQAHDLCHPELRRRADVRWLRARALVRLSRDEEARKELRALIESQPQAPAPRRMLSALYLKDDQRDKAVEQLRAVATLQPDDLSHRRELAMALCVEDPEDAAHWLASTEELMTSHPQLGLAGERPSEAMDALRSQTENQAGAAAWTASKLYRRAGRLADADALLQQLLVTHAEDPELWLECGKLAADKGDDASATRYLQHAIDQCKNQSGNQTSRQGGVMIAAESRMALVDMHAGRFARAGRRWFRLAQRGEATPRPSSSHPGSSTHPLSNTIDAWAGLLICALICNRKPAALKAQAQLHRRGRPSNRREALAKMWVHAGCGLEMKRATTGESLTTSATPMDRLLREALSALEESARKHPQRADTHHHLAACLHALGEPEEAILANARALMINPNYSDALALREEIAA